jgi:hypothetical protein
MESWFGFTFGWKVFDGGIRSAEANAVQAKAQQSTEQGKLTKISNQPAGGGCLCRLCGFQDLGGCRPSDVSASSQSRQAALDSYRSL